jgi:hypothetical protein
MAQEHAEAYKGILVQTGTGNINATYRVDSRQVWE